MSLFKTENLTSGYAPEVTRAIQQTVPGMAHFSGTGPAGKQCFECQFYQSLGYHAQGGKYGGKLKASPCGKFREMMRGEEGPRVPPTTPSCKYFTEVTKPRPLFARDAYKSI